MQGLARRSMGKFSMHALLGATNHRWHGVSGWIGGVPYSISCVDCLREFFRHSPEERFGFWSLDIFIATNPLLSQSVYLREVPSYHGRVGNHGAFSETLRKPGSG